MGRPKLISRRDAREDAEIVSRGARGRSFVFTGKLSSMTQREARERVRALGGFTPATVSPGLSFLVVGSDGWPIGEQGRLSDPMRRAIEIGPSVTLLTEARFLRILGIEPPALGLYPPHQVTGTLGISREYLRLWQCLGVLKPAQVVDGVAFYGFRDLSNLRTLTRLLEEGASPDGIRQSLQRLRGILEVGEPLKQLTLLAGPGGFLRAQRGGETYEYDGQLVFDFARIPAAGPAEVETADWGADRWAERGAELEDQAREIEAAGAYEKALGILPGHAGALKAMAGLRHAEGNLDEAAAFYQRALDVDPSDAYAWYGLGTIHQESNRSWKAIECYGKAVEALPDLAAVHYAMGESYFSMGLLEEAIARWAVFLEKENESHLAARVRRKVKRVERRLMGRGR